MRDALTTYEDHVLRLLPEHNGVVVTRVATVADEGQPDEIQLLRFEGRADIQRYMEDTRRVAREAERAQAIARTEVLYLADPLPDSL